MTERATGLSKDVLTILSYLVKACTDAVYSAGADVCRKGDWYGYGERNPYGK